MFKPIISADNATYKYIKKLSTAHYRAKTDEFLVEGKKEVEEAIKSDFAILILAVSQTYLDSLSLDEFDFGVSTECIVFPDKLFADISTTVTPQGILCVCKMPTTQAPLSAQGIYLYCDMVADPGNLGTIIRAADAAGLDGVILSKGCTDPYAPKTIRATMGSIFHLPIIMDNDSLNCLKLMGYKIVAGALDNAISLYDADFGSKNIVLVVGNESNGIRDEILSEADMLVKIPMRGKAESLNVATAAAIMIYEIIRQNSLS